MRSADRYLLINLWKFMGKKYEFLLATTLSLVATSVMSAECTSQEDCVAKLKKTISLEKYEEALDLATQGCEYGHADSCAIAGSFYQLQQGVDLNPDKLIYYFEKACELGSDEGCSLLVSTYFVGEIVPRDIDKTYKIAQEGCEIDNAVSCMILGILQVSGEGTKQSIASGKVNLDRACMLDEGLCQDVAKIRSDL